MKDAYTQQMEQWIQTRKCEEITVMLDKDWLRDWARPEECGICLKALEADPFADQCAECQAVIKEARCDVEERVFEMYPGCSVVWLPRSGMGEYSACHPYCIEAPDEVYETVMK
jgi:hypothetical protein